MKTKMMDNRLGIFLSVILSILFFISFVSAQNLILKIGDDGKVSLDKDLYLGEDYSQAAQIYSNLDPEIKDNVDKLGRFALKNFPKGKNGMGMMLIDGNTKLITVIDEEGNTFAEIPNGFYVRDSEGFKIEGKSEIVTFASETESTNVITGVVEKVPYSGQFPRGSLVINGYKIESDKRISIIFSEKDGKRRLEMIGEGDVLIGGVELKDVKNLIVEADENNEIQYADFVSLKQRTFEFAYKKLKYEFKAKKNGRIIFDPENGIIKGERASLAFGSYDELGDFYKKSEIIGDEFSVNIEDGAIKKAILGKDSQFVDVNGNVYSSSEQFDVYFDNTDVSKIKNAVSINENDVFLKGKIEVLSENGLNYKGLEEKSYTKYVPKEKLFDVVAGDASINNGKHNLLVKDGVLKLSIKNLISDKIAEGFTVAHTNKLGVKEIGILDENSEGNARLTLGIFDKNDRFKPISSSILPSPDKYQRQNLEASIQNIREQIKKIEGSENPDERELNRLKTALLLNENKLFVKNSKFDDAIKNTEKFLKQSWIKENPLVENNIKISLAELYGSRAKTYNLDTSVKLEGAEYIWGRGSTDLSIYQPLYFKKEINTEGKEIISGWGFDNKNFYAMSINPEHVFSLTPESIENPSPSQRLTSKNKELIRELHEIYNSNDGIGSVELLDETAKDRGVELSSEGVIAERFFSKNYNLMTEDYERSNQIYEEIKVSNGKGSDAYADTTFGLARNYISNGKLNEAYREYETFRLQDAKTDEQKSKAYYGIAVVELQRQNFFESQRAIKESASLDPSNSDAQLLKSQIILCGLGYTYAKAGRESGELFGLTEGAIGLGRAASIPAIFGLSASNDNIVYTFEGKSAELDELQGGIIGWSIAERNGRTEELKTAIRSKDFETAQVIMAEIFNVEPESPIATKFARQMGSAYLNPDVLGILNNGNVGLTERILAENNLGVKADKKWSIISGEYIDEYKQIFNEPRFISGKRLVSAGVLDSTWDYALTQVNGINAALLFGPGLVVGTSVKGATVAQWAARGTSEGVARLPGVARASIEGVKKGASSFMETVVTGIGESRLAKAMPTLTKFSVGETFESIAGGTAEFLVPGSGLSVEATVGRMNLFTEGIETATRRAIFDSVGGGTKKIILTGTEGAVEGIEGRMFKSEDALKKFLGDVDHGKYKGLVRTSENLISVDGKKVLVYAEGNIPASVGEVKVFDSLSPREFDTLASDDLRVLQEKYGRRVESLRDQLVYSYGAGAGGGIAVKSMGPVAETSPEVFRYNWGQTSAELIPGASPANMDEIIIIDDVPYMLRQTIKNDFDSSVGRLLPTSSPEEFEERLYMFSESMNRKLPFLTSDNLFDSRLENWNHRVPFYEYLDSLKDGNVRLSHLIETKQLDCTGQALAIRESLGGKSSGWELYHGMSESGNQRVHTFLAKEFDIGGEDYVGIVDPTEMDLYRTFNTPPNIKPEYLKSHGFVLDAEEFYMKGYTPANIAGGLEFKSGSIGYGISAERKAILDRGELDLFEADILSDSERLYYAEVELRKAGLLEKGLTNAQGENLLKMHYMEEGGGDLRILNKIRVRNELPFEQRFSAEQTKVLMENGIVGKRQVISDNFIFRTPAQLKNVKFNEDVVYVRFENVRQAEWPGDGEVGNLPFMSEMVNPARGPRISTFTLNQLEKDRFFFMNPNQKKDYLARFGIRTDLSNRKMVYFKLEEGIQTEKYMNKYTNIIVGDDVPAVKVVKIKKANL